MVPVVAIAVMALDRHEIVSVRSSQLETLLHEYGTNTKLVVDDTNARADI
jgi:hypothetical protein